MRSLIKLILVCVLFYSCKQKIKINEIIASKGIIKLDSSLLRKKIMATTQANSNYEYNYAQELSNGKYSIVVNTICSLDTVQVTEKHLWEPVVINQYFEFKKDQKTINLQKSISRRINQKTTNNCNKEMLENVVFEVSLLRGSNSNYYYLSGFGGCNSCSILDMVFDEKGKIIYSYYSSEDNRSPIHSVELNEILKKTNSKKLGEKKSIIQKIRVYPPIK
jgi:hypothetical protein